MEKEQSQMTTLWTQFILLHTTSDYFTITVTIETIRNALTKPGRTFTHTFRPHRANTIGKKVSTRSAGYHGANNLRETGEDTHDALINLATAAADMDAMMKQSKTISKITATISNLTQQLQQATVRINTLKIPKEPETPTNRPPKWVDGKHICDAGGHCWTHRYFEDINQNRVACQSKNGGHQDDPKHTNNKGGYQYGNPSN